MKLLLFFLLLSTSVHSQAILGYTMTDIRDIHSSNEFEYQVLNNGVVYHTDFDCAQFAYFIENGTDYVSLCLSYPHSEGCLSGMVENYNRKYVIISDMKWHAYLESGLVMEIELEYNTDKNYYYFAYSLK